MYPDTILAWQGGPARGTLNAFIRRWYLQARVLGTTALSPGPVLSELTASGGQGSLSTEWIIKELLFGSAGFFTLLVPLGFAALWELLVSPPEIRRCLCCMHLVRCMCLYSSRRLQSVTDIILRMSTPSTVCICVLCVCGVCRRH